MPEDAYCCSGCPSLGGPSGIGGSFYCESGDDQIDLATRDGRPLRSAQCVAANQPLLTREEFLAAVRECCEDDELVLPESALRGIGPIQRCRDRDSGGIFVRLRDDFAYLPTRWTPATSSVVFVGCATWGDDAVRSAFVSLSVARHGLDSLEAILAGLGEAEPAKTD